MLKKLCLSLGLIIGMVGIADAAARYQILIATQAKNVAYQVKGSQKYSFAATPTDTPTVVISSFGVQLPNMANSITGAGSGSGLDADKLDGINSTALLSTTAAAGIYQPLLVATSSTTPYHIVVDSAIYAYNGGSGGTSGVYDGVPVGGVILYSTTTAPSDFLYCNGSAVSRTTYSALFSVIGTRYGTGDGSTTFNVPDMRGLFARGLDDGKGIDKDGSSRVVGSTENFSLQGHFHRITGRTAANTSNAYLIISAWDTGTASNTNDIAVNTVLSDPAYGTVQVSSETRPSNMAWAYMIKYRVNISTQGGILDQANTWTAQQTYSQKIVASKYSRILGYLATNQNDITSTTSMLLLFKSTTTDSLAEFSVANSSITVKNAGLYRINCQVYWSGVTALKLYGTKIYLNGVLAKVAYCHTALVNDLTVPIQATMSLNANDAISFYCYNEAGANTGDVYGDALGIFTYFSVERLIDNQ